MLMGLATPRAVVIVDNSSMTYLGDESSSTDSVAAHEVWQGPGIAGNGGIRGGGHHHCAFPASQRAALVAFVEKLLLDNAAAHTDVLRSDRIVPDRPRWSPWQTSAVE